MYVYYARLLPSPYFWVPKGVGENKGILAKDGFIQGIYSMTLAGAANPISRWQMQNQCTYLLR